MRQERAPLAPHQLEEMSIHGNIPCSDGRAVFTLEEPPPFRAAYTKDRPHSMALEPARASFRFYAELNDHLPPLPEGGTGLLCALFGERHDREFRRSAHGSGSDPGQRRVLGLLPPGAERRSRRRLSGFRIAGYHSVAAPPSADPARYKILMRSIWQCEGESENWRLPTRPDLCHNLALMDPTRRALEDVWREHVRTALVCYRLAANETRLARTEQANGLTPEPDGFFAYRQALEKENRALAEYRRVLGIFADLAVHGQVPKED